MWGKSSVIFLHFSLCFEVMSTKFPGWPWARCISEARPWIWTLTASTSEQLEFQPQPYLELPETWYVPAEVLWTAVSALVPSMVSSLCICRRFLKFWCQRAQRMLWETWLVTLLFLRLCTAEYVDIGWRVPVRETKSPDSLLVFFFFFFFSERAALSFTASSSN